MSDNVFQLIKAHQIEFVNLIFTDLVGSDLNMTLSVQQVTEDLFKHGQSFDGSSIRGWQKIHASDMILMPEASTATVNPFCQHPTLDIICHVLDPRTLLPYNKDPRGVARRAEEAWKPYADELFFGPEPEFTVFDGIRFQVSPESVAYHIEAKQGAWNSSTIYTGGNKGHRPHTKGGYLARSPMDTCHDLRSTIAKTLQDLGQVVEVHHHEVAGPGQHEVATRFNTLTRKADEMKALKYVVRNVGAAFGKSITFMPKPILGDNGNGCHVHISAFKEGNNLFFGDHYGNLSQLGIYFMGGILSKIKVLNAFVNPTTNSYRRLVPHCEAPIYASYSALNRSALIRIPHVEHPKAKRIEIRVGDPCMNPYLGFAAYAMAGLWGVVNKIEPGDPLDKDLYDLPPEIQKTLPSVAHGLDEALHALDQDRAFLLESDVFSDDIIDAYIDLKREQMERVNTIPHPAEFEEYYSD